jgi:hypothetical protein
MPDYTDPGYAEELLEAALENRNLPRENMNPSDDDDTSESVGVRVPLDHHPPGGRSAAASVPIPIDEIAGW